MTDSAIPEAFLPARSAKAAESETESTMEQAIISGVAHDRSEAKVTIVGVPDIPGKAAEIFKTIAAQEIDIDMIVQNISTREPGKTDISFTLPKTDGSKASRPSTRRRRRSASTRSATTTRSASSPSSAPACAPTRA